MQIPELYDLYLASKGICIDTRKIEANQIFFSISGDNFDGNSFAKSALEKGAAYAIIDNESYFDSSDSRIILVQDCLLSLQKLANHHRNQFDIPVIAITGSNGKTTTKELLTQVLRQKFRVHATAGNFNNHLGVPLTILSLPTDSELMIVEMGANHIGEIKALCHIAEPNFGLITNIGKAHIEGFGSVNGVIQAKTELYKYLASQGRLIFYNNEDKLLFYNLPDGARAISYLGDLEISNIGFTLSLSLEADTKELMTNIYGDYNRSNILAAYTIGNYFGIDKSIILEAIADYAPKMNRSQIMKYDSATLILDAYNANPSSMIASITSFAEANAVEDKVIVLGDMKELGSDSIAYHQSVVNCLQNHSWKEVYLIGDDFSKTTKVEAYNYYDNFSDFEIDKRTFIQKVQNTICLIKASRSLKLERISAFF